MDAREKFGEHERSVTLASRVLIVFEANII